MAYIIHSINATLSGTCFHEDVIANDEHHRYATKLVRSAEALLLGRKTYDLFADFWPSAVHRNDLPDYVVELAHALTEKPKIVVSSDELCTAWENTTRVDGPELGPLREALSGITGNVVLFGSPSLAGSLAEENLLDEINFLLQPLFSMRGPRLPFLWHERPLRNVSASRFESGVVLLRYKAEV